MNFNGLKSSEVEVSRTTYGSNKLPDYLSVERKGELH